MLLALCTLCLAPLPTAAQQVSYHSEHLEAAARKTGISERLDTMRQGVSYTSSQGHRIEVRINADRQVEHIGMPLFSLAQREMQPSPAYDFLEYALLDNTFKVSQNPFDYVNVFFRKGSWKAMASLPDTAACSLSIANDKVYTVAWTDGTSTLVEVAFPIIYDMLANSSRKEMEKNFVRDLRRYVMHRLTDTPIDTTLLQKTDDGLYVLGGDSYILSSITDSRYFIRDTTGTFSYVTDAAHPAASLANMALATGADVFECDINVVFCLYAGSADTLLLPLPTLVAYCRSKGCRAFFGYEGDNGGLFKASLFFYDRASGYDHVVYLSAPREGFAQKDYTIDGTMYLYAPTSNVENLFYNPEKGKKKNIKYED